MNGDSHIDLVTADTVLLSDGLGSFGAPVQIASGPVGSIIMLRDITGDGHLDIAGTIYGSNQVIVLSGEGNGVFAVPTYSAVGLSPWAIAAGDFNGDNRLDLATANHLGNSTSVLLNNGVWPDLNAPRLRIDVTVVEGDSGTVSAVFTVTRSGNLNGSASVFYSTANGGALAGSDYIAVLNTGLTFGPGESTKTITILVNGDRIDEYDQGFFVNLSNASGAVITDGQGFGTILDNDDAPTISITSVSKKEGGDNRATSCDFVVTLSAASEKEVRVNFATADGTASTADNDYIARSGTLIFAPGVTRQTISVQVKGDKKRESDETFFVNLSVALNATIGVAQGLGVILDEDAPGGKKNR